MSEQKEVAIDFKYWMDKIKEEYAKQKHPDFNFPEFKSVCLAQIKWQLNMGEKVENIQIGKVSVPKVERPKILKITNYYDNVVEFHKDNPFFYDKSKIFWFWNNKDNRYEIVDDTDMMNLLDDALGFCGQTISSRTRSNYLEAFKRVGRKKHPKEAPKKWVQFKDKAFSLKSGKTYNVKPNYFFTNPIPWDIGESESTPVMDKLFSEWVGEDKKDSLYEILAYCCYAGYPIHLAFCLIGSGRNGKSQFQKVIHKFTGEENVASSELDAIADNRFETFKMYKKLVVVLGETNFGLMSKSSMFKKLTGGDLISFEKKGKDPFDDYSYAKLIINSNSLPITEDTSEGFYRRWYIIDFPNEFPEGKEVYLDIPDQEYNNLAKKICNILPSLLEKGEFCHQGDIVDRKERYIFASNPLSFFINQCCDIAVGSYIRYTEFYNAYVKYLLKNKKRVITHKEFCGALSMEGFEKRRTSRDGEVAQYVENITLKVNWEEK